MTASATLTKPVRAFGGFIGMSLDTLVLMFTPPFAWREYLLQTWFVARVSVLPALMLTLPYSVLLVFTFNILLGEFGAADFSGTGAAIGTVNQIGPDRDGAGGLRRRRHRDVRRPGRAHHPRGTRRAAGDGHQPDPGAGRPARARGHHGGAWHCRRR